MPAGEQAAVQADEFLQDTAAGAAGAMKVCLVIGNLDQLRPSSHMRLCMAGVVRPAYLRADGRLAVLS